MGTSPKDFWVSCPSKISLFCCLASENKILTLVNIAKRDCNSQNATDTCVLCHKDLETVDHLFLPCEVSKRIWVFFEQTLNIHPHAHFLSEIWTT